MPAALCVDFGSTFTKAVLVETGTGALLGTAEHRTTIGTDVLDGYDACRAALVAQDARAEDAAVLACSSAGGGLRIAVVGNEELVTAEAGRRVALSSGGKVVLVLAGGLSAARLVELKAAEPDVVLLVGGTDGGNSEPLLADAAALAGAGWPGPVVVAGDATVADDVARILAAAGTPYVVAANVVPRIGVLAPDDARRAIREMFLSHVIGGKHLSRRGDFTAMVRGATPDLVLTGVEVLASSAGLTKGVVVVDVGGATTDVHSVVELDPEDAGLSREVVATTPVTRTVEGDLGMRWSALTTYAEGLAAGLVEESDLAAAQARHDDPSLLPTTQEERAVDERIATAAVVLAVRRHVGRSHVVLGPDGRVVERSGKDLREAQVLVGSGGVLRNNPAEVAARVLGAATGPTEAGWQQPEHPRLVLDRGYVLAAVGLLATDHPEAAAALARSVLAGTLEPR